MSEDKRPTVRDIEWCVNPEFSAWVSAEDQKLFPAGIYAAQVVQEHNELGALRKQLAERGALSRQDIPDLVAALRAAQARIAELERPALLLVVNALMSDEGDALNADLETRPVHVVYFEELARAVDAEIERARAKEQD